MPIEKVERFYCPKCDYTTERPELIKLIKKGWDCPVCNNGKAEAWTQEVNNGNTKG